VVALLTFFVWPWGNQNGNDLKARYEKRSDLSRVAPGQFQSSSDGSRVFFIDRSQEDPRVATNVFILQAEKGVESVTSARGGRLEQRREDSVLVLERGQRNEDDHGSGEKTLSRFERYSVVIGERSIAGLDDRPPKARPTLELIADPTPAHRGELTWRLGLVLGGANFLLLGIGLAATNPRKASNWNLLFALLAFVVYFNLINLTQAWVANGRLGMGTALLLLHGTVFAASLALIWWREHGTVRSFLRRRPAASTGSAAP
jgi:lipopolysaccharide export system permease protein